MRLTRIGGPTVLVELDGWRLLVDPTFDPAGRHYSFGWGTGSTKTAGPAIGVDDLGPIDVALVSHDHHDDNLDDAGRAMLPSAGAVVTTASGAGRLAQGEPGRRVPADRLHGLVAGQTVTLAAPRPGLPTLVITATPCRHGPPLTHPIVGDVIGFAVRRKGEEQVALWITGDTVLFGPLRRVAEELSIDVMLANVGGVRFGVTGPLRFTMTGRDVVDLVGIAAPRVATFAHYDGWSHFVDGEAGLRDAIDASAASVHDRAVWLVDGVAVEV
ncbi:L-ascorbate metabolism protein UlaG, beta-lactamase superfamily [Agromyces sp. CF514]|uniref:MBL fold metallo-hydrolase n=1 Tax=Agromyces sp. CF514 TaxID=1881031 RepID=UPI0008EFCFA3|nr:MBL fold metallo-hydrolase [Agromyces sp. CF514]SFR70832.1 L-ascorbate metabolism protein UlaG, beta-lactamase superfamily [Agromyces sp. CF514]